MRRSILIAALAVGAGCVMNATPNRGDATLYWSFWVTASNGTLGSKDVAAREICGLAGVDDVRLVLVDPKGDPYATFAAPCVTGNDVPGAVFTDLEIGPWHYDLTGFRGGVAVFHYASDFTVFDGADTVVDTYPTALYWDLSITLSATCGTGDTVRFDVIDTSTGRLAYSTWQGTTNPVRTVPCANGPLMTLPSLPGGSYKLVNVVQRSDAGVAVAFPSCIPNWTQPDAASKTLAVSIDTAAEPPAPPYCS